MFNPRTTILDILCCFRDVLKVFRQEYLQLYTCVSCLIFQAYLTFSFTSEGIPKDCSLKHLTADMHLLKTTRQICIQLARCGSYVHCQSWTIKTKSISQGKQIAGCFRLWVLLKHNPMIFVALHHTVFEPLQIEASLRGSICLLGSPG